MAFPDEPKGAEPPSGETVHEASVEASATPSTTESNPANGENLSYGEGWSTSGVSASEHAAPVHAVVETAPVVTQTAERVAERASDRAVTRGGAGSPPKPPDPP